MTNNMIDEKYIRNILTRTQNPSVEAVLAVLEKARDKKGLTLQEAGLLTNLRGAGLQQELFKSARRVKNEIYGERLVFFAPLYVSDFCVNDCEYCNFHTRNKELERKKLTLEEIDQQVRFLIAMGHKRLLLEFGEDLVNNNIDYVVEVIDKVYSIRTDKGNIRRLNINIAATTVENYRKLKNAKIGTYQLFQETYRKDTYEKLHSGPKKDYERQITAHLRAFEGGIDDLGLGVLFGLYDWRFEVLALISHAEFLDRTIGVGPHTISVPRFCPAPTVAYKPEYLVSDEDFLKIIAILRLAVPYTGMIISTRENPRIRKIAFSIGISQASACSVTSVGGYGLPARHSARWAGKSAGQPQFSISDERTLQEVIKGVLGDRLLPSFCTACYRLGRTGERFMELSKPGDIHNFCRPNGLLTFAEYLEDFASDGIYKKGYEVINFYLSRIEDYGLRNKTKEKLEKIRQGERDLYF